MAVDYIFTMEGLDVTTPSCTTMPIITEVFIAAMGAVFTTALFGAT